MATPYNPDEVQDFDQPLNTAPMFSATHVFSTDNVTGTFSGLTQADLAGTSLPVIDFTATPIRSQSGVDLYPVNSEFGFNVTDFFGAEDKDFYLDPEYEEGFVGDIYGEGGEQIGIAVRDAPTDTFKAPSPAGTWLAGLGGNSVKASSEHYSVMQNVLSDQLYPQEPGALINLDDDLRMTDLRPDGLGGFTVGVLHDAYILELSQALQAAIDNAGNPDQIGLTDIDFQRDGVFTPYDILTVTAPDNPLVQVGALDLDQDGTADVIDGALNGYGADADITDILQPNESSVIYDLAYGDDYSVTLKDDGKLLYRWGNLVKRPNDVRMEVEIPLPDEWNQPDDEKPDLIPLFKVIGAELVTHHHISNNPNDQIRPEGLENEAAIGRLPSYTVQSSPDGDYWISTVDAYAGDGTFYPAGTVLRDPTIPGLVDGTVLDQIGAISEDLEEGFTNAYYTTMDREPFEPVLTPDGTEYADSGPRWRLKAPKYGQDLPGVDIQVDTSVPPPARGDNIKYESGAETQTVLNLLDWEGFSPLTLSAGWQNAAGTVDENGLNLTPNFDVAFYVKGEGREAILYSTELVMDYEELPIADEGDVVTGGFLDDILVGEGNNTMTGGIGEDVFVVSYGKTENQWLLDNTITDFQVGFDKLGLINLDVNNENFDARVTQTLVGSDLQVAIDGYTVATLQGQGTFLEYDSVEARGDFLVLSQQYGATASALIVGTAASELLEGDAFDNEMLGLAGADTLNGLGGDDTLEGGTGADALDGGADSDTASYEGSAGWVNVSLATGFAGGGAGSHAVGDTFSSIENLTGSAHADILSGDAGANMLSGGDGDDLLRGRAGADVLDGGEGSDTATYDDSTGWVNVSLATGFAGGGSGSHAIGDSWIAVENLIGSMLGDRLNGSFGDNRIEGLGGDDIMKGYGGADTFVFAAGFGNDQVLDFEDGADLLDFSAHAGVTGIGDLTITDVGADALVDDGAGNTITLTGAAGLIGADDFLF